MNRLLAVLVAAGAIIAGVAFQDAPYRIKSAGMPCDQAALAHSESPYTSMTWVASETENYLQLRFFDKVEGGLCLKPSWADLITLANTDPRLAHLVPGEPRPALTPGEASWPHTWLPDPGTLPNSAYVRMFPLCLLLNDGLMGTVAEARLARADVLVVGLGSGVGIGVLAHHFPNVAVTVVDIDRKVEDSVMAHHPLLNWLTTQTLADGTPRLTMVAQDARQYVKFLPSQRRRFDAVILDAYTAGSTIPSHLMTREFFAECKAAMTPDGILMANIIGSYLGTKRQSLGGAMRSFRAAGLPNLVTFPNIHPLEDPAAWNQSSERNNQVLSSAKPITARSAAAAWERLRAFTLFPELQPGQYVSRTVVLSWAEDGKNRTSQLMPLEAVASAVGAIAGKLKPWTAGSTANLSVRKRITNDKAAIDAVRLAVATWASERQQPLPIGWDRRQGDLYLEVTDTDWLLAARETWRISLHAGRTQDADALVGPVDGPARTPQAERAALIPDAPLFTDQRPNADILNR